MPATIRTGKKSAQARTLVVEWEFADEDHEWQLAQTTPPAAPAPIRQWGWRCWAIAAGALLAVAAGGWLWVQAHAGLRAVEGEIQAAVEADRWRSEYVSRGDAKPARSATDMAVRERLPEGDRVQLLDLGEEWATVEVTSIQGGSAYRQTRLYRRGVNGWYAAVPSAAVWGRPRTLETDHFIFHYYARDAEDVAEAAAKLDALYPDLAASYPLDPAGDAKHQVRVSPKVSLGHAANRSVDAALEVASPATYLAPTELSRGDILAQAVLLELLGALADQSRKRNLYLAHDHHATAQVYALLESLQLWELWSTDLPLATMHEPTIQWVYSDMQGKRVPPAPDANLCLLHQLWAAAPKTIQIPLFCVDPHELERYEVERYFPFVPPRSLAEIQPYAGTTPDEPYRFQVEAERIGLATLFDYAATTYGRQSLATLIANSASLSSWETLIPATFGVSPSDFETGWQAHLRDRYGVSASTLP